MFSRPITKILLLIILLFGLCSAGNAEDVVPSDDEKALMGLINQARHDPLGMAESLGMDPDEVLADLPELEDILIHGLPPLGFNGRLYDAATGHNIDMIENSYYSHESLDGATCEDRIIESGYDPALTGESLGMLGFANFIKSSEAVELVFENMFLDELNPERTERRNILCPELREFGVSVASGPFSMGGSFFNVYLAVCDFGSNKIHAIEQGLLHMINQARHDPLGMAKSLGMDTDQVLADLPELEDILIHGLPPLTFNRYLYAAAVDYAEDMIEIPGGGSALPPGSPWNPQLDTHEERIIEHGYVPVATGEIRGFLNIEECTDLLAAASMIFEALFRDELDPERTKDREILNPVFREAGSGFRTASIEGDGCSYLWVCDFGLSETNMPFSIVALVYEDLDEDGLFSLGEGIADEAVTIKGEGIEADIPTGYTGGLSIMLEPGNYEILAGPLSEAVEIKEDNVVLYLELLADKSGKGVVKQ